MKDFSIFRISIEVTEQGLAEPDEVVSCVFAYIG